MITTFTFLLTIAAYHLLVGSLLVCIALLMFRLIKVSPETKSWVWVSLFILSTLLPLSLLSKEPTSKATVSVVSKSAESLPPSIVNSTQVKTNKAAKSLWHVPSAFVQSVTELLLVLCVIWALGTVWRFIQVTRAAIRTNRLYEEATLSIQFPNGFKGYRVLESKRADSPMIIGVRKPAIVLPTNMTSQLNGLQLTPIMLHEVAHIQRNDMPIGILQELLAMLFWWSPIIRLINKKIHINRELSCDLRAASQLDDPKQYAQSLLEATRMMLIQRKNILAMGLFSKKGELNSRIDTVLNARKIANPNRFKIAAICLAICTATLASANQFGPDINVDNLKRDANHFSKLSEWESERIVKAMSRSNPDQLIDLINNGMDINTPIVGDGTPLIIAVRSNNRPMVEALIEYGADVNQSALGDGNPLIVAAQNNRLDLAQILVQQGADVNAIVSSDETPLIQASWNGHKDMVEFLVASGADVNLGVMANPLFNPEWRTQLNKASTSEIRAYLIDNGAVEQ